MRVFGMVRVWAGTILRTDIVAASVERASVLQRRARKSVARAMQAGRDIGEARPCREADEVVARRTADQVFFLPAKSTEQWLPIEAPLKSC